MSRKSELNWLERRLEILSRAIVEMEAHLKRPHLDPALNPDVTNDLSWACREVERIGPRIAELRNAA